MATGLQSVFKLASVRESPTTEELLAANEFVQELGTYLDSPDRIQQINRDTFGFGVSHFIDRSFSPFPKHSAEDRSYSRVNLADLEELQTNFQQVMETWAEKLQNGEPLPQIPDPEADFANFMGIHTYVSERIQHTRARQLANPFNTQTFKRSDHETAMESVTDPKQRALYTLGRLTRGNYEIADADIAHVQDQLDQLQEGIDSLSGGIIKDTPRLFEISDVVAAMGELTTQWLKPAGELQVADLQKVAPLIEKIDEVRANWGNKDFPHDYKDSRPAFYLDNKISSLNSIKRTYQIAKLLEVAKDHDAELELNETEQIALTLAQVASGDNAIKPADLAQAETFLTSEQDPRKIGDATWLADRLLSQMKQNQLVTGGSPSPQVRDFVERIMPSFDKHSFMRQPLQDVLERTNTVETPYRLPVGDFSRDGVAGIGKTQRGNEGRGEMTED